MTLNHYEVVKPEHPQYNTVNRLIRTLTLSSPDDCTITFVPKTEEWNVDFIRHKKRCTYVLDDKYMVTVSSIRECKVDWPRARSDEILDVTPDLYDETHTEIEVWVCPHSALYLTVLSFFSLVSQHSLGVCLWT